MPLSGERTSNFPATGGRSLMMLFARWPSRCSPKIDASRGLLCRSEPLRELCLGGCSVNLNQRVLQHKLLVRIRNYTWTQSAPEAIGKLVAVLPST